jgi:hypothetical protein
MELEEEVARAWSAETGLEVPFGRTIQRWLDENGVDRVLDAIAKTGRRVRSAAGSEREFSIGQAACYTGNILKSAREARGLAVTE